MAKKKKILPRYKEGDTFNIEVTLVVEEVGDPMDGDWIHINCEDLQLSETWDIKEFDDLVNPNTRLVRLQKERDAIDQQIEKTKKRLGG